MVKDFLARVKERALGEKVATRVRDASGRLVRVTPGQHFVKICEEELTDLMGPVDPTLARGPGGVISVMLVGLQGVGKTTVAAKLARHLQSEKRRPLLVAADVYRPAAVLQLQQLGEQTRRARPRRRRGREARRHLRAPPPSARPARGSTRSSTTPPAGSPSTRR